MYYFPSRSQCIVLCLFITYNPGKNPMRLGVVRQPNAKNFKEYEYFCQALSAFHYEQTLMTMPSSGRSKQLKLVFKHAIILSDILRHKCTKHSTQDNQAFQTDQSDEGFV
ncbi:hypothetical protein GOODEAATRI_012209 [Goodea atripinnis]|uniref:Uncharacterized protein n=1 Tax=Goodea atripinnis TaxID=208336 RepID=A0ABV0MRJ3_9TELE